jgi:phosphosulfolactate synthase (CoM biosynthesis protein A)
MINALGLEKVTFEAAEPEVNLFVDHSQIVHLEPLRPGI